MIRRFLSHTLNLYICLFAVLFLAVTILYLTHPSHIARSDFPAYLVGGRLVKSHLSLYNLKNQLQAQREISSQPLLPFRYPPFAALMFLPFSLLPIIPAYWTFFLLNLLFLATLTLLGRYAFPHLVRYPLWPLLPLSFYPFFHSLWVGQVSIFLALILLVIYISLRQNRPLLSGLFFGLFAIKPHLLLSLLPVTLVLIPHKLKFSLGLLTSLVFLTLIGFTATTPADLLNYPSFIKSTENPATGTNHIYLSSLYSFLLLLPTPPRLASFIIICLYLLLLIYLKFISRTLPWTSLWPIAIPLAVTLTPHISASDLALTFITFFYLLSSSLAPSATSPPSRSIFLIILITLINSLIYVPAFLWSLPFFILSGILILCHLSLPKKSFLPGKPPSAPSAPIPASS
ncbi:hypothetical protein A2634_02855 [Candidatus Amesbacteria bacterium RIFCSPHIGHO2_01_FULL_48_32]|nr:MAG: hypothetical protein A2634_02855 [Candidatus Amesbacteria bacterium RIFCSPHIGHO2_01_FULL_48_32]